MESVLIICTCSCQYKEYFPLQFTECVCSKDLIQKEFENLLSINVERNKREQETKQATHRDREREGQTDGKQTKQRMSIVLFVSRKGSMNPRQGATCGTVKRPRKPRSMQHSLPLYPALFSLSVSLAQLINAAKLVNAKRSNNRRDIAPPPPCSTFVSKCVLSCKQRHRRHCNNNYNNEDDSVATTLAFSWHFMMPLAMAKKWERLGQKNTRRATSLSPSV